MTEAKSINFIAPVSVEIAELGTEPMYSRVCPMTPYPADATTHDQMNLTESSGVLGFWNDPAEDVYTEGDDGL